MKAAKFYYKLHQIAAEAASVAHYQDWSDEFSRNQIKKSVLKNDTSFIEEDILSLSENELISAGFRRWNDKLVLIPLWFYNFIPDGMKLTCIDGSTVIFGQDKIDKDILFGCIAYGFLKEKEVE